MVEEETKQLKKNMEQYKKSLDEENFWERNTTMMTTAMKNQKETLQILEETLRTMRADPLMSANSAQQTLEEAETVHGVVKKILEELEQLEDLEKMIESN